MGRAHDYTLDRSGGSTLALCQHCEARVIRAEARAAARAICEHLRQAHADDRDVQRRLGRR